MKFSFKRISSVVALSFVAAAAMTTSASAFDGWHQESSVSIPGKGASWDYVSLDAKNDRLYIGRRSLGLQVFDLKKKKVIKTITGTDTESSNGAVIIPEFDLGISVNEKGTITPFKLSTLEAKPHIKLGAEADFAHYDTATKRIVVNVPTTELPVLQLPSLQQVGVVKVSTKKPEHADSDGKGNFYMTARDESAVYNIDTKNMTVKNKWPTPGCAATNGLALDVVNKRIFLGCRGSDTVKPSFAVMNAETGAIIYTAEIGGGNDTVVYDADLKRIILAGSVHAVMNIFEQVNADTYKPVEAMGVHTGVRTIAMHPKTKKIYTFTTDGSADFAKKIVTSVSPFYSNTFFTDKSYVLTYSK